MKVQESKKQLAGVLLSPHGEGYSDEDVSALEVIIVHRLYSCLTNWEAATAIFAVAQHDRMMRLSLLKGAGAV